MEHDAITKKKFYAPPILPKELTQPIQPIQPIQSIPPVKPIELPPRPKILGIIDIM